MRKRSETLGTLGRAPARSTSGPIPPISAPPVVPAERGAIRRWLHGALFDNLGLKFLSIVLAVTVFLLVNTDRDREMTTRVHVLYLLPDGKVLVSDRLDEVRVTLKGPPRRLPRDGQIEAIDLDLRKAPSGEVSITPDMIKVPSGVSVTSISPRAVRVAFDKRVEKVVPIQPYVTGRPVRGYVVDDVKAVPSTVKIRGAARVIAALAAMKTEELSLDNRDASFSELKLLSLPEGVDLDGSQEVLVQASIKAELITRALPGLTVEVRSDDGSKWKVEPATVDVSVTGERLAIEQATVVPVVKAPTDGKHRDVEVTLEGLSSTVGRKISPERVTVTPAK